MWCKKCLTFISPCRIMTPPKVVEKNVGEKRLVFHAPVGIAVCPELDMEALSAGIGKQLWLKPPPCYTGDRVPWYVTMPKLIIAETRVACMEL
jgi:hypothetical protein